MPLRALKNLKERAMALTKEEIISEVKSMTVLDLNNLVKAFEEEFGVSAAAMAMPAAGAPAAAAPVEEEKTEFTVVLAAIGANIKKKFEEVGAKVEIK